MIDFCSANVTLFIAIHSYSKYLFDANVKSEGYITHKNKKEYTAMSENTENNIDQAYEAPATEGAAKGDIDDLLIPLMQTRPWVLLCSILGFISTGFMVIMGLFMMVGLTMFMPEGTDSTVGAGFGVGMGLFYLVLALIFAIPPYWLFKNASAIKRADSSRAMADVEEALRYQKSFWKFIGIVFLIYLVFLVLGLVIALIGGVASSF